MAKAKSWKTSLMGIIGITILFICLFLVYTGKCTLTELASFLSPVALFIGSIVAFLTKDSDVTGGARKG
jgi:TRAP-type C4-dicarboxylate transport system permease large subunit